ncbi:hypothetical protein GCM10028825_02760 [Spirosoma agri]
MAKKEERRIKPKEVNRDKAHNEERDRPSTNRPVYRERDQDHEKQTDNKE